MKFPGSSKNGASRSGAPFQRHFFSALLIALCAWGLIGGSAPSALSSESLGSLAQLLAHPSRLNMPPVPTGEPAFNGLFEGTHFVSVIENGQAALEARLRMIEKAEAGVDLEYFIFEPDTAGIMVLQALLAKKDLMDRARKPFRIRLLLDWLSPHPGDPGLSREMLSELQKRGMEIKLFHEGLFPTKYNYRSHKKIFLVDGKELVTGGRNIEDRYFSIGSPGIAPKSEYYDTDIYVRGPAAAGAQGAFEAFWASDLSTPAGELKSPDAAVTQRSVELLTPSPAFAATIAPIRAKGSQNLAQVEVFESVKVVYLSDRPGQGGANRRTVRGELYLDSQARQSVVMENWTMIPLGTEAAAFTDLLKRKIQVVLVTNSLRSGDESNTADLATPKLEAYAKLGMHVYGLSGKPSDDPGLNDVEDTQKVWSTHAKVSCVDGVSCFIGTANNDARSENINAEDGVIVLDTPEFAQAVQAGIQQRLRDAYVMTPDGRWLSTESSVLAGGAIKDEGPTREEIHQAHGIKQHIFRVTTFLQ